MNLLEDIPNNLISDVIIGFIDLNCSVSFYGDEKPEIAVYNTPIQHLDDKLVPLNFKSAEELIAEMYRKDCKTYEMFFRKSTISDIVMLYYNRK